MSRRNWLLFAAMCVIWGVPYLMIRVAVRELAPVTLVFLRTAIGAVLLVPVAAWRRELRPLVTRWWPLLAYTVVEVVIPWVLLARAETKLTSSLTGLLIAAVPLVGAVVVAITGSRERQGRRRWLGLLVGIGGTGLGLYICRELIRRLDGRIWVDSNDVKGSTFFVEVPIAKDSAKRKTRERQAA